MYSARGTSLPWKTKFRKLNLEFNWLILKRFPGKGIPFSIRYITKSRPEMFIENLSSFFSSYLKIFRWRRIILFWLNKYLIMNKTKRSDHKLFSLLVLRYSKACNRNKPSRTWQGFNIVEKGDYSFCVDNKIMYLGEGGLKRAPSIKRAKLLQNKLPLPSSV